jgi:hypothetical protein
VTRVSGSVFNLLKYRISFILRAFRDDDFDVDDILTSSVSGIPSFIM